MELYVSIAVGIMLGELGKEIIYRIQNAWWTIRHRKDPKHWLRKWLEDTEDTEELLAK